MSSIDPALHLHRATSTTPIESREIDPASLLLALSFGQMSVMQEMLTVRVSSATGQFDTLGRIGAASSQLQKFRDAALSGEQDEAQDLLKQLESFRTRHVAGDQNSLVVNESEQQDLADALEWARQRGFAGPELTWQVEVAMPPKTETESTDEGATETEPPEVEIQTVVDEQAFLQFQDRLKNYIADLKTGAVDNPALRSRLADHSDYEALVADLNVLGIRTDLDSFEKIDDALAQLETQFNDVFQQAAKFAGEIKHLTGELQNTAQGAIDLNRTQFQLESRESERQLDDLRSQLETTDLTRNRQQQLDQLFEDVQAGLRALAGQAETAQQSEQLLGSLTESARLDVATQLATWQTQLDRQLETLPPPAAETDARPHRISKNYV